MNRGICCLLVLANLLVGAPAAQAMESESYYMPVFTTHAGFQGTSSDNFLLRASVGGLYNGEPEESEYANYKVSYGFWRTSGYIDTITISLPFLSIILPNDE